MGCEDTKDAGIDSMDMYSRVKLRASNRNVCAFENDIFAAEDDKSANARLSKSRAFVGQGRFSAYMPANLETAGGRNALAVENARLTSLTEITEKEIAAYSTRSHNQNRTHRFASVGDFRKSDILLDEGTAIEMLDALRTGMSEDLKNGFDIGDMVWGKVTSHPWWPGHIFDQAQAPSIVYGTRRKSTILVAFYGDYTYAWLEPANILPFDSHYAEKVKQTKAPLFFMAVDEATDEIKRRAALGLFCHCQKPSYFPPMKVGGLFDVDAIGYTPEGAYSMKQIEKAREDFQPLDTLSFLKQLALSPINNAKNNICLMRNLAKVLAYRRAVFEESDKTPSHGDPENPTGNLCDNEKASQASFSGLDAVASEKMIAQPTDVNDLLMQDYNFAQRNGLKVSDGGLLGKVLGDHDSEIRSEQSKCCRQEGPYNLHILSGKKRAAESGIFTKALVHCGHRAENPGHISKDSSQPRDFKASQVKYKKIKSKDDSASVGKEHTVKCLKTFSKKELVPKSGERSNAIDQMDVEMTMLVIKFPPQMRLPSVSELKAKFTHFGPFDESSTRLFSEYSIFRIVFLYKNDAEAAYHYAIQTRTLFGGSGMKYHLQGFTVSSHESHESGQSLVPLENQELQPATSLTADEYAGEPKHTLRAVASASKGHPDEVLSQEVASRKVRLF